MHGNVWEWCEDDAEEGKKVDKGGCWTHGEMQCKISYAGAYGAERRRNTLGLRLIATEEIEGM